MAAEKKNKKLLAGKKIVMIVAFQDFRDEECFIPRSIFLGEGADVAIASSKKGKAVGSYGGALDVNILIDEIDVSQFDAIVFVGGAGAVKYIDDDSCHQLAREAIEKDKLLGAICIAPAILARAGVLKGKKATVWSSNLDKSAVKILKEEGAKYQREGVVVDKNIVTANGPLSARKFGQTIVQKLAGI